jgi:outer membrane protein assembly factor BamE
MTALRLNTPVRRPAYLIVLLATLWLAGCVYRIPIQQGNFLEPEEIAQVNPGMTRSQVRYLLGTPMVADPFDASRWDYVYYLKRGRIREPQRRHFVVYFEGDKVTRVEKPIDNMPQVDDKTPEVEEIEKEELEAGEDQSA